MDHPNDAVDNREVKFTYEELLQQNKSLAEELTQCRADKDFVWTLWKRLQADKPDVSSAVSMVIHREQEKSEAKDRKVLAILKEKDNNIRILEEIAADLEVQLKQSMERLSGLLVERTEWEGKIDELRKTVQKLDEEKTYQQEVMKARETQNENERKNYLAGNEALAKSNKECSERIKDLELEVDKLSKEKSSAATLMETNTVLRDKIKVLEKDLELTKREHDEKISKLKLREGQLLEETIAVNEQLEQVEQKDAEIATLSSELRKMRYDHEECLNHIEEQNAIIKNLQLLQDETQLILKNQQESHKSEVKSYKNTLNELRMKCLSLQSTSEKLHGDADALRKSLSVRQRESTGKDMVIADLKESLKKKHEGFDSETQTVDLNCSRCRELEEQLEDVKEEFESLKDIVQEKGRRISSLEKVLSEQRRRNMDSREDNNNEIAETNSNFKSRIRNLEKEIEDLSTLLTLKDNEVQETRRAHSRRLQRYNTLKENYSIINKQLRTFQQDAPLKAINDVNIRADPKSLQREDSEAVWNELAFYRKQYNLLKNEREDFEEEIDNFRVKNMASNAKIKELEIELDHEHSECVKLRSEMQSKAKFVCPSKMYSMETQVEIWRKKSKQLELQNEALNAEKEALTQREKYYKKEIVGLTDEIDHIHKNIRDKIDAEVQASEAIEALEQQANKSLDRIATSVNDRKRHLIEQYIQTSPISPIRRLSPKRPISQSTQSTQTIDSESSSEHEFPLSRIPNHIHHKPKRQGPERDFLKERDKLFAEDLQTPHRNIRKVANSLSPVVSGKIYKRKKMPPKSSPAVREQTSLKVRILSLQQQVDVLRSGKSRLGTELQEQKEYNETVKGDLDVAVKKLEMSKVTIQRLSDEVQRCISDRENLEKELENERKKTKPPEIGYKEMENRWKLATTECSKLSFQVKTLRGENEMISAKQREFQERIVWLERQLNQKKQLLEDMKEKLKEANQTTAKEKESLEEMKKKNKSLLLNEDQKKKYIDDLRNKINQISLEKIDFKKQLQECKEELKRKSRLLQQSQDLCSHAEKAVSEMEKAAFDQLHEQATEQKKLYANLKQDLSTERRKVVEYQWVIKNLVEVVLKDTHHLQLVVMERRRVKREEEIKKQKSQESMKEARDIACSILDMTSEEIELLLDEEPREQLDDTPGDDVRDILKTFFMSIERFSKRLLKLLLELLGKHWKLRMQEQLGVQA